ncbi:hypothetical protein SORBI_3004G037500 [Sorghum bicolor]|uniref:Uncharacterized protein n=1 Tax=Sorghum bicolor TaxID=4558 RepID=A0A1Z5RL86_SORBI|nr:hypothetical protein SORBI_3004G037500 [Sorghum bicolor]
MMGMTLLLLKQQTLQGGTHPVRKRSLAQILVRRGWKMQTKKQMTKCISNEADLICELLKHGAKATDGIIQQSSMIRMCTLSLMHLQLQGFHAIDAAAAMVGITKECKLMCDWIKKEDKLITFGFFTRHRLEECRLIRIRTLDVMLSILKGSSFPPSKMWLDLVANN